MPEFLAPCPGKHGDGGEDKSARPRPFGVPGELRELYETLATIMTQIAQNRLVPGMWDQDMVAEASRALDLLVEMEDGATINVGQFPDETDYRVAAITIGKHMLTCRSARCPFPPHDPVRDHVHRLRDARHRALGQHPRRGRRGRRGRRRV